jgi:hypothetical protein
MAHAINGLIQKGLLFHASAAETLVFGVFENGAGI